MQCLGDEVKCKVIRAQSVFLMHLSTAKVVRERHSLRQQFSLGSCAKQEVAPSASTGRGHSREQSASLVTVRN